MGDLQTLANIGKHRGMFANDVTCTHGGLCVISRR